MAHSVQWRYLDLKYLENGYPHFDFPPGLYLIVKLLKVVKYSNFVYLHTKYIRSEKLEFSENIFKEMIRITVLV